ncbi:transmembrane receptor, partial [Brachionus plicatilis]
MYQNNLAFMKKQNTLDASEIQAWLLIFEKLKFSVELAIRMLVSMNVTIWDINLPQRNTINLSRNLTHYTCSCDDRYGSLRPTSSFRCDCECFQELAYTCGCFSYNRVYRVKNMTLVKEYIGTEKSFSIYQNTYFFTASKEKCAYRCLISYNQYYLSVSCPSFGQVYQILNCDVTFRVDISNPIFEVKNGNGLNGNFQRQQDFSMRFTYATQGSFETNFSIRNSELSLNPVIMIYPTLNLNDDVIKSEFLINTLVNEIGCFNLKNFENEFGNYSMVSQSPINSHICIQKCSHTNHKYAILMEGGKCYCTSRYGLNGKSDHKNCECVCLGSYDFFCGCEIFYLAYKIKDIRESQKLLGSSKGCFKDHYSPTKITLSFNTNGICMKHCLLLGYRYFSTESGNICNCFWNYFSQQKTSENRCNYKCPGNSTQLCGGPFGFQTIYEIKETHFTIEIPRITKKNDNFNFSITKLVDTLIEHFPFRFSLLSTGSFHVEFNFPNNSSAILKFNSTGFKTIEIKSEHFNFNPLMYLSDTTNYSANKTNLSNIEIFDFGNYSHCLQDYSRRFSYTMTINGNPECSQRCVHEGLSSFSTILSSSQQCRCGINIWKTRSDDIHCMCACFSDLSTFCGCDGYHRIFDIYPMNSSEMTISIYKGCSVDYGELEVEIGFLNNKLCIQYCHSNGFNYSLTQRGYLCKCSGSLNQTDLVSETECNFACNANSSEYCGGIHRNTVYQINKLNLSLSCNESVLKYETAQCSILINFGPEIDPNFNLSINFVDFNEEVLLPYNDTGLLVTRSFNRSGNYTVKVRLINYPLFTSSVITVEPSSEILDNNYQGCFYDRIPYDMSDFLVENEKNLNNKKCNELCRDLGFNFSSTHEGKFCACMNKFGSYNRANDANECNITCSGDESDVCGGVSYQPVSVYKIENDLLQESRLFSYFTECITVDLENFKPLYHFKNHQNCINLCKIYKFYLVDTENCYCANNYSTLGIDRTNALCDINIRPTHIQTYGGSVYFTKSVYRVTEPRQELPMFYALLIGCYSLNNDHIKVHVTFKGLTITKCLTYCSYFNQSYAFSDSSKCYCLEELSQATEKDCSKLKVSLSDGHYVTDNNLLYIYQAQKLNIEALKENNYDKIGCSSENLHEVLVHHSLDESKCVTLCQRLDFNYTIRKNSICYCGNSIKNESCNGNYFEIFNSKTITILTTVLDITTELTSDNMISTYIPSIEFERTTSADQETANNTFLLMSTRDLANFISSVDYDITGCLINCTNNGKCKKNIISKKFECSCVEYYYGNDCRTSRRICTNEMQCLNSGTCIDMIEFNREKNT